MGCSNILWSYFDSCPPPPSLAQSSVGWWLGWAYLKQKNSRMNTNTMGWSVPFFQFAQWAGLRLKQEISLMLLRIGCFLKLSAGLYLSVDQLSFMCSSTRILAQSSDIVAVSAAVWLVRIWCCALYVDCLFSVYWPYVSYNSFSLLLIMVSQVLYC